MGRQCIEPSIIKKNIKFGCKVTRIWSLNPKPIDLYIAQPKTMKETKHSNSKFEEEENQQWVGEKSIINELYNITITSKTTKSCYYVNMPHSPIATQMEGLTSIKTLVVDLENLSMQKGEKQSPLGLTQEVSQVVASPFTCKTNERIRTIS